MLHKIFGDNFVEDPPKKHQITIFKKKGRRSIKNLEEMVSFIEEKYEKDAIIKVIDPSKISIKAQINLMLETTLLISPCGGISMIGFFLPHGSSIIVTDFIGYEKNGDFSNNHMEAHLFNALFWINDYYMDNDKNADYSTLFEENNYEYRSIRDNLEIEVNLDRLDYLIKSSFIKMSN